MAVNNHKPGIMKITALRILSIFSLLTILIASCNDNKEKTSAATTTEKKSESTANTDPGSPSDNLMGGWNLSHWISDKNRNKVLDPEEANGEKISNVSNYIKFRNDGTALYTVGETKIRYEVKEEEGKKKLILFDPLTNEEMNKFTIYSLTENELQLFTYAVGEPVFHIYKRE